MSNFRKRLEKKLQDPAFQKAWADSEQEHEKARKKIQKTMGGVKETAHTEKEQ